MERYAVVFDADGVLFNNFEVSAFSDILLFFGFQKQVRGFNKLYQLHVGSGFETLDELAALYKGMLKEDLDKAAKEYSYRHTLHYTRRVTEVLRKMGVIIGAISCSPQFVLDELANVLSLDFVEGTVLDFENGIVTGRIKRKINAKAKAEVLRLIMRELGIEKDDLVVVGDSDIDIPMGEAAGVFVAFQPKDSRIMDAADFIVRDLNMIPEMIKGGLLLPNLARQA